MNAPLAIRWLNALYSDRCALPIATKGVLCGIFVRIDWESGRGYFEAARSLGKRANCGKNTVTRHLTKAVNAGWLMRTTRAVKGERHGFTYSLAIPAVSVESGHNDAPPQAPDDAPPQAPVSQERGHKDKGPCPHSPQPVSLFLNGCVRQMGTYSPSDSPSTHRGAGAPRKKRPPNLRAKIEAAARTSSLRADFDNEHPDVAEVIRRLGGWQRLGQSNEERELPRLLTQIIKLHREGVAA
jgi:hypothetical protein